jgi:hypothetical protein
MPAPARRRPQRLLPSLVAATVMSACSSGLVLDDHPFEVASCGSGQIWGFLGVDLIDQDGRRIFVAWTSSKRARVTVFEAPTQSVDLGLCGKIDITTSDERARPYAVSGDLSLECAAHGHTVRGGYTFSGCR